MIRSNTFGNCNCDTNCGCQFNLPSTHGFCQFVEGGHIEEGYFNDISLTGLNWAFQLGLTHGAYCLGCCWALMGLLFVGGVMNLMWILAITLFVLLEKLLPQGLRTVRITGMAMVASGIVYYYL